MTEPDTTPPIQFVACIGSTKVPVSDLLANLAKDGTVLGFSREADLPVEACREAMYELARLADCHVELREPALM